MVVVAQIICWLLLLLLRFTSKRPVTKWLGSKTGTRAIFIAWFFLIEKGKPWYHFLISYICYVAQLLHSLKKRNQVRLCWMIMIYLNHYLVAVTGVVVGICAVAVVAVVRLSSLHRQQRFLSWETLVRTVANVGSRSFACLFVLRPKICCRCDQEGGRLQRDWD